MVFSWDWDLDSFRVDDVHRSVFGQSPLLWNCARILLCRDAEDGRRNETVSKSAFSERAGPGKFFPHKVFLETD